VKRVAWSSLLALYAAATASAAQIPPDTTARIAGTVRSSVDGLPMAGVTITVRGTTVVGVSDSAGAFALAGLPPGRQTVRIHYGDTLSYDQEMTLEPGKALILAVLLDVVEDVALTPIVVDTGSFRGWRGLAGLYDRKKSGRGRLYTPADLARFRDVPLETFLSVSGVVLRCRLRHCVPLGFNGAQRCVMALYLNAVLVPPEYLEVVRVDQLAGVEVYLQALDVPARFRAAFARDCGATLLWSRN
jgi:Carboxypeptidase regulatory-like domain